MKKNLIPSEGRWYKANLHGHSTVSDGELTPAQIKELYLAHGYSIVAYTDHNHFVTHNELSDGRFLALNGVEDSADETGKSWMHNKCCDICFIAGDAERKLHPMQYPDRVKGDGEYAAWKAEYTPIGVNGMIRAGRENGFFVTHNHPCWSLEEYRDYMGYRDMHAMEIYNHSSAVDGYNEYNPDIYDDQLRAGKRLFVIATDDNHNRRPGTCHWDSFGGWTMIKAKSLAYRDVTDALFRGDFYASRGPVVNAMWLDTDDCSVHVECEKAVKVVLTRGGRRLRAVYAAEEGVDHLTEVRFSVDPDDIYFRVTVFDENGMTADTNAYFIDALDVDFSNVNIFKE